MPKYVKFLKDLLGNQKKLKEASCIVLSKQCLVAMLKILTKMRDPKSLNLPCQFGNLTTSHALADSGGSINLMPCSFYSKLNLTKSKPTQMAIHLAHRLVTYLKRILEDVLVKVGKSVFLVDFVVLDMKEDCQIPIILGIPFFSTAG